MTSNINNLLTTLTETVNEIQKSQCSMKVKNYAMDGAREEYKEMNKDIESAWASLTTAITKKLKEENKEFNGPNYLRELLNDDLTIKEMYTKFGTSLSGFDYNVLQGALDEHYLFEAVKVHKRSSEPVNGQ